MQDNLAKYEAQFGRIDEAEAINEHEIGFKEQL
jgi:hypothetical protein